MGRIIQVEVEVDDIEDISTGRLVGEVARRGREVVLDALVMLKTGRIEDGIVALEREFFPRYADEAECKAAYLRAMGPNPREYVGTDLQDHVDKAIGLTIAAYGDEGRAAA